MSRNSTIPHPPYFSDQILGFKPPTPALLPSVMPNTAGCIPSVAGDGGYFVLTTTTIAYFNKANTQVWTLSASSLNFSGVMTNFLGFMYYGGTYYLLVYRSGAIGLTSLSSPYTNNNTSPISVAIAITSTPSINLSANWLMPSGANYRCRFAISNNYYDVVFSASTKISEAVVTQNSGQNVTLSAITSVAGYESTDATMQASLMDNASGNAAYTLHVERNGKIASIPANWIFRGSASGGALSPVLLDTRIYWLSSGGLRGGYYCVDKVDFDRYLKDVCDVMGL